MFRMGEVIASLDGYFCSPGDNFDRKRAGVSRILPAAREIHAIEAEEFGKNLMAWRGQSPQRVLPRICSADAYHYSQTTKGG